MHEHFRTTDCVWIICICGYWRGTLLNSKRQSHKRADNAKENLSGSFCCFKSVKWKRQIRLEPTLCLNVKTRLVHKHLNTVFNEGRRLVTHHVIFTRLELEVLCFVEHWILLHEQLLVVLLYQLQKKKIQTSWRWNRINERGPKQRLNLETRSIEN